MNTFCPNLPAAKSLQRLAVRLLYIPRIKQSAIGKHNSSAPQKCRLKPRFPSGDPAEQLFSARFLQKNARREVHFLARFSSGKTWVSGTLLTLTTCVITAHYRPAELRDIIQTPFLPFGVCCLPLYSDKHCTLRRYVYFRDFEHNAFV